MNYFSLRVDETIYLNAQIHVVPARLLLREEHGNGWNTIKDSRRGHVEIMAGILRSCQKEKTKTKIMYANNIGHATLRNHLELLASRAFLESRNDGYVTTEKGFVFLELFAGIHDMMENDES